MPLIPPPKHTGLIVVTLWQNNFGHPSIKNFENDTLAVVEEASNLSLQDVRGGPLPHLTLQNDETTRRLASWVARLVEEESANTLARKIKNRWIGPHQPATIRGFDVGNGYSHRTNYAMVLGVLPADIYQSAFDELKRRESGNKGANANPQANRIADYIWRFLTAD
jgi:hypothetical protein